MEVLAKLNFKIPTLIQKQAIPTALQGKDLVGVAQTGTGKTLAFGIPMIQRLNQVQGTGLVVLPTRDLALQVDEALRQVIAVGGTLERTAILDNFCWGNTDKPDRLGGLVRAAKACYDIARVYGTPFISGKDSLNNEFQAGGITVAIPGTLLVSAISVMEDVTRAVTMDLKKAGNLLYVVGLTKDELGGSQFYAIRRKIGRNVPVVDPLAGKDCFDALSGAIAKGLVRSCHDLSDGGLAVAVAEMAFAGCLGIEMALDSVPAKGALTPHALLFSESPSRFVVEVEPEKSDAFRTAMGRVPAACVGTVTTGSLVTIVREGHPVIECELERLRSAWKAPLAF